MTSTRTGHSNTQIQRNYNNDLHVYKYQMWYQIIINTNTDISEAGKAMFQTYINFRKILAEFSLFFWRSKNNPARRKYQQRPHRANRTTYIYMRADKAAMAVETAQHTYHTSLTKPTGHNPHTYIHRPLNRMTESYDGTGPRRTPEQTNIYNKRIYTKSRLRNKGEHSK